MSFNEGQKRVVRNRARLSRRLPIGVCYSCLLLVAPERGISRVTETRDLIM